jgi:N-methylhydantoinase A
VSGAFGVEDPSLEGLALRVAADLGVPACAGHELSGLYGLEARTVTAALNASILPQALAAASVVERAVAERAPGVPLLVMRGDGGAADLATMRRRPLLTAFSGPAASVAGALRHLALRDGVVVEVGGTSTNVSAVRGGRPVLAYVRVLDHVTFVRSLDVRVVGVAGGSLLRVVRRPGRAAAVEVGPRSAHIAGLPYCSFADPPELEGGEARLVAPRPGDPPEYAVVETPDGRRFALTLTCAANALGRVPEWAHARGNRDSARLGFLALGRLLRRPWEEVAERALWTAARRVGQVVAEVAAEQGLEEPPVVGLGGGAGALVPALADLAGLPWSIPLDAEVMSSVGDALSLVRVEVERGIARPSPEAVEELVREAEEAAVAAGAAPATVQVETEAVPERGALRAVAVGSAALRTGGEGGSEAEDEVLWLAAKEALGAGVSLVARTPFYAVFTDEEGSYVALDRYASLAAAGKGVVVAGSGTEVAAALEERLPRLARHLGPVSVPPAVRLVRGARLVDLTFLPTTDRILEAAVRECRLAGAAPVVALVAAA